MLTSMNILSDLRRQRKWSQSELARHSGLHASTISLAESGRLKLSAVQLAKLAKALGVDATALTKS